MRLSDWLPPILARKMSQTLRAVVLLTTPGHPVATPRKYERLAKEGYEANVTVYACINEIAKAIGGLSWLETERRRGRDQEVEESDLLRLLARPNPQQGQSRFFQNWAGYLMISGNSYIERVGPGLGAARLTRPPKELWTLRPDRVEVITDPQVGVQQFRYTAGGVEAKLPAPLVHHMTLFGPTNDWYGLSPIQVAASVVDTDNAAQSWNLSLIKNGMRPSGALVVQKSLTDAQFKRAQTQMIQEYAGEERAGLPLLLEGGMDWKEMGINPKDLDWVNSRRMSKQDITTLYGVPAELIGLKEATYENRREAKRAFYTETVLPLADLLRDELNAWLVPLFDDSGRRRLDYDRDAIEALQEDREKVWTRVRAADWLTVNEKRAATGYDDVPAGDVLLVPFSVVPLGEVGQTGPDFGELPAEDEGSETRGRRGMKAAGLPADPARERQWKAQVRQFQPIEQRYAAALKRFFAEQRDEVLRKLMQSSRVTRHASPVTAVKAVDELLFELDEETGKLRQVSRPFFQEALARGGAAVWLEVGGAGSFGEDAPAAQLRLADQLRRVGRITETVRTRLARTIETALNEPDGVPSVAEIASRIRETYRKLEAGQAQTIARTETAKAFNEGREEGMDQLGVEETEWLSARDNEVREAPYDHAIDGETQRRGQAFSNGLRYPHDPSGAAGNVINCRCVALPVVRR